MLLLLLVFLLQLLCLLLMALLDLLLAGFIGSLLLQLLMLPVLLLLDAVAFLLLLLDQLVLLLLIALIPPRISSVGLLARRGRQIARMHHIVIRPICIRWPIRVVIQAVIRAGRPIWVVIVAVVCRPGNTACVA